MTAYYHLYPQHDPKWNKADVARWANAEHTRVTATIWAGNAQEKTFTGDIGNHNHFGATDRSDILVDDEGWGWRCIWFMNRDIKAVGAGNA